MRAIGAAGRREALRRSHLTRVVREGYGNGSVRISHRSDGGFYRRGCTSRCHLECNTTLLSSSNVYDSVKTRFWTRSADWIWSFWCSLVSSCSHSFIHYSSTHNTNTHTTHRTMPLWNPKLPICQHTVAGRSLPHILNIQSLNTNDINIIPSSLKISLVTLPHFLESIRELKISQSLSARVCGHTGVMVGRQVSAVWGYEDLLCLILHTADCQPVQCYIHWAL